MFAYGPQEQLICLQQTTFFDYILFGFRLGWLNYNRHVFDIFSLRIHYVKYKLHLLGGLLTFSSFLGLGFFYSTFLPSLSLPFLLFLLSFYLDLPFQLFFASFSFLFLSFLSFLFLGSFYWLLFIYLASFFPPLGSFSYPFFLGSSFQIDLLFLSLRSNFSTDFPFLSLMSVLLSFSPFQGGFVSFLLGQFLPLASLGGSFLSFLSGCFPCYFFSTDLLSFKSFTLYFLSMDLRFLGSFSMVSLPPFLGSSLGGGCLVSLDAPGAALPFLGSFLGGSSLGGYTFLGGINIYIQHE